MGGYWPGSFLRVDELRGRKKRTSLVNNQLITWLSGNFSCGRRRVVPSGQDSSILPARVANHSAGFHSSCPLKELVI